MVMVASLAGTLYLSLSKALEHERDKLFSISKSAIYKTRTCFDQIYQILSSLEKFKPEPCSEQHIQLMRSVVFNQVYVSDIEYLENDIIKCSASGFGANIALSNTGFDLSSGVKIIFNVSPLITQDNNFIALRYNNYSVLINSSRFSDIMIDPYLRVAILTDEGQALSLLNSPDPELIKKALENSKLKRTQKEIVAISRIPDLYVIASESTSYVMKKWRSELLLFIPFGLLMAAMAIGIIIFISRRRLSPVGELKIAISRREFLVYYQPLIDFKTGACSGAEALIRWQRPDGPMIRPDVFIPLAEDNGLIDSITDQVIETIIVDMKNYLIADRKLHIAVNIAVEDFNSGRIIQKIESCLTGTGIQRQQIWLEITERGFMDINACREKITHASQLGYIIVIDDFGTGYSSLSYLKELPIDILKIDKSFINTVTTHSVTSNVTYHIISIAKSLNLKIVAEGIETQAQADYLKSHKVDYAQGWLYAKAMPVQEFIEFYQKTNKSIEQNTKR
jgi:sensor c-di-GMP phosphodiesterase-like protein